MLPLISREEALRLGDLEDRAGIDAHIAAAAPALEVTLWDPSSQLRHRRKSSVPPPPDGSPNRGLRSAA